jgi:hypothetical protein
MRAARLLFRTSAVVPPIWSIGIAGSETHLADALTGLLTNPAQCAEMGLAAKRRVSQWGFGSDVEGFKTALDAVRRDIDRS